MITDWPHVLTPREAARVVAFKTSKLPMRPAPRHVPRKGLRAELHSPAFSLLISKRIGRALHSRWYVYRYDVGGFMDPHLDAEPEGGARGSFLLYLTTSIGGGETLFHLETPELRVPLAGHAVSFGYDVKHSALEVTAGVKWCMRSDLL